MQIRRSISIREIGSNCWHWLNADEEISRASSRFLDEVGLFLPEFSQRKAINSRLTNWSIYAQILQLLPAWLSDISASFPLNSNQKHPTCMLVSRVSFLSRPISMSREACQLLPLIEVLNRKIQLPPSGSICIRIFVFSFPIGALVRPKAMTL